MIPAPLDTGWRARVMTCVRNVVVICGVACIPFAADLASNARVNALASHHPNSAIADPAAARVPSRSAAGGMSQARVTSPRRFQIPPKQMYFTSTYSSMPYLLPSRPRPDCFTPPKGATCVVMRPVFTPTMPASSASAARQQRPRSRL